MNIQRRIFFELDGKHVGGLIFAYEAHMQAIRVAALRADELAHKLTCCAGARAGYRRGRATSLFFPSNAMQPNLKALKHECEDDGGSWFRPRLNTKAGKLLAYELSKFPAAPTTTDFVHAHFTGFSAFGIVNNYAIEAELKRIGWHVILALADIPSNRRAKPPVGATRVKPSQVLAWCEDLEAAKA